MDQSAIGKAYRAAISFRRGEMSMRFHRPLTLAFTVLPSAGIVKTMKSYEQAGKTLIGTTEWAEKEIRLWCQGVKDHGGTAKRGRSD